MGHEVVLDRSWAALSSWGAQSVESQPGPSQHSTGGRTRVTSLQDIHQVKQQGRAAAARLRLLWFSQLTACSKSTLPCPAPPDHIAVWRSQSVVEELAGQSRSGRT